MTFFFYLFYTLQWLEYLILIPVTQLIRYNTIMVQLITKNKYIEEEDFEIFETILYVHFLITQKIF